MKYTIIVLEVFYKKNNRQTFVYCTCDENVADFIENHKDSIKSYKEVGRYTYDSKIDFIRAFSRC